MTDTELREAVARALAKHDRIEICSDASYALSSYGPKADAALSLMQPEIDRRVAEEKAKLLERFDEDELEQIISNSLDMDWLPRDAARAIRQAMLAQYEKDDVARPEVFSRAIVHLQKELQKALDDATTLSAENEKLRRALREAPAALNAMAAQVEAEFRDHDKAAARHDAIVMAFKKKVRQALAGDDHGHR